MATAHTCRHNKLPRDLNGLSIEFPWRRGALRDARYDRTTRGECILCSLWKPVYLHIDVKRATRECGVFVYGDFVNVISLTRNNASRVRRALSRISRNTSPNGGNEWCCVSGGILSGRLREISFRRWNTKLHSFSWKKEAIANSALSARTRRETVCKFDFVDLVEADRLPRSQRGLAWNWNERKWVSGAEKKGRNPHKEANVG